MTNSINVTSNAKIVNVEDAKEYKIDDFSSIKTNKDIVSTNTVKEEISEETIQIPPYDNTEIIQLIDKLDDKIDNISNKLITINDINQASKDLDTKIIKALKDLKNYATFFEKLTFDLETKMLKTSMNIAQKIIGIEVSEQSAQIAKITINDILNKIKTASQVTIHLSPKDYILLKDTLKVEDFIVIKEDENVSNGGVVIASDLGNFDGNIDSKIKTILESIETIM